jgi:oligopeptide/dipeptide ABC transporter ATP-binding protein
MQKATPPLADGNPQSKVFYLEPTGPCCSFASQLPWYIRLAQADHAWQQPTRRSNSAISSCCSAASRNNRLAAIDGQMPTTAEPDAGCVFAPRCPFREPHCSAGPQPLTITPGGHRVRCWKADAVGPWPRQQVAAGVASAFRRGDALVNATRLSKTFDASRGLTAWRLSVAAAGRRFSMMPVFVVNR